MPWASKLVKLREFPAREKMEDLQTLRPILVKVREQQTSSHWEILQPIRVVRLCGFCPVNIRWLLQRYYKAGEHIQLTSASSHLRGQFLNLKSLTSLLPSPRLSPNCNKPASPDGSFDGSSQSRKLGG